MREPDEPWLHWHRPASPLDLPTGHILSRDPLHRNQTSGKWYFGEPRHLSAMIDRGTKAWFDPPTHLAMHGHLLVLKLNTGWHRFAKRHLIDFGSPNERKWIAERVHQWIAHVCLTTSIAVSSSKEPNNTDFYIPSGFFFNARALELVVPGMVVLVRHKQLLHESE